MKTLITVVVSIMMSCSVANAAVGNLVDNGNNTVSDTVMNLTWTKYTNTYVTWQEAYDYCNALDLADRSWRLPGGAEYMDSLFPADEAGNPIEYTWLSAWMKGEGWVKDLFGTSLPKDPTLDDGAVYCVSDGSWDNPAVASVDGEYKIDINDVGTGELLQVVVSGIERIAIDLVTITSGTIPLGYIYQGELIDVLVDGNTTSDIIVALSDDPAIPGDTFNYTFATGTSVLVYDPLPEVDVCDGVDLAIQEALDTCTVDVSELTQQQQFDTTALETLADTVASLEHTTSTLEITNSELSLANSALSDDLANKSSQVNNLLSDNADVRATNVDLRDENNVLSNQVIDLMNRIAALEQDVDRVSTKNEALESRNAVLAAENKMVYGNNAILTNKLKDTESMLTVANNTLSAQGTTISDLNSKIEVQANSINSLNQTINELEFEIVALQAVAPVEEEVKDKKEKKEKKFHKFDLITTDDDGNNGHGNDYLKLDYSNPGWQKSVSKSGFELAVEMEMKPKKYSSLNTYSYSKSRK